ncbi:chemotaxis protein CheA [Thermodesulfomicrobium sp. WS]|nr:chemotaxis protein CheA [Thermodesulfomicrobium sp. WS]
MDQRAALHRQAFVDEAVDLLAEWETCMLALEQSPDAQTVDRLFRAVHTLKGAGGMFGFEDLAAFLHHAETLLDRVRAGEVAVSRPLVDLFLACRDHAAAILDGRGDAGVTQGLVDQLAAWGAPGQSLPGPAQRSSGAAPSAAAPTPAEEQPRLWRIRFRPQENIFRTGLDPASLVEELMGLGSAQVVLLGDAVPPLSALDPESCALAWEVLLTTTAAEPTIRDVFIFVEGDAEVRVEPVPVEDAPPRLGELLARRGDAAPEAIEAALAHRKPVGEVLVEAGVVAPAQVEAALAEQRSIKQLKDASAAAEAATVRVPAAKLDALVDLVGELVTAQARLSQVAMEQGSGALSAVAEEMERLTDALRDTSLSLRMLPIGSTFARFRRLVRDLSTELGKDIALVTVGEDTELDKTMLERLGDPLVHLLRNSVDHGIEPPHERQRQGKPAQGTIRLVAEHAGGEVVLTIEDDGRGIDVERVRAKALEKGIISADVTLSHEECLQLIFAPGLSTAQKVSNVSGRGVGMDVVKRNIEALRGRISIASTLGQGTTITIRLPLTLAIIDGLLVRVQDAFFVLPLAAVEECVELTAEAKAASSARLIALRGDLVPYVEVRQVFGVPGTPPPIEQAVIVRVLDRLVGVVVDAVVGEHQTVIKSLGRVFQHVRGVSGATILGDGTIALIVDLAALVL